MRGSLLQRIKTLDPLHNNQRIVYWDVCFEFPFDTTRALELALFRTYCVPSISALLDRTQEFAQRPQKRYDDTDIIVSELMEWGYDSARGTAALARMNRIHSRFAIHNEHFLYVLSTFVFEPIRWNARFGWRRMCEQERLAFFYFWREVGARMGMQNLPEDYASFERFNIDYEAQHFQYAESNRRIGIATRELFASWFPKPLRFLVRRAIYALLDEPVRRSFGFPQASLLMRGVVIGALKLRAYALRLSPERKHPRRRSEGRHRSYGANYRLEQIGPPYMTQDGTAPHERP